MPVKAENFTHAMQMGTEIFHNLKKVLHDRGLSTAVGDEGGFAPNLAGGTEDALDTIAKAVDKAGYKLGDDVLDYLPATAAAQEAVEPIYESMPGWSGSTRGARSWNDLPAEAVKYVRRLEELVGKPCALVSTSPEREDVILMRDPFEQR